MAADLNKYVAQLRGGNVVACPTETQMGLLGDALDARVVAKVQALKGRADDQPIGVLVPSLESAVSIVSDLSASAVMLAQEHWPGPLTLVMYARPFIPDGLVKDKKVAVRVPGPSAALDLVTAFGGPLTATSANRTGEPPAADEAAVRAAFGDGVAGVVPGEPGGQAPSTVVDVSGDSPVVLRPGPIEI